MNDTNHTWNNIWGLAMALLLFLASSPGNAVTLSQVFPHFLKHMFSIPILESELLALIIIGFLFGVIKLNSKVTSALVLLIPIAIVLIIVTRESAFYPDTSSAVKMSLQWFTPLFVLLVLMNSKVYCNPITLVRGIVLIGAMESLLGMYQHFTNHTVFDVEALNSIFLNSSGRSASDINVVGLDASTRAFGTLDSGLVFGIFMVFCLFMIIDFKPFSKLFNIILLASFGIATFASITRNVYVGCIAAVLFCIFIKVSKRKSVGRFLFVVSAIVSSTILWLSELLAWIIEIAGKNGIPTFAVRFQFLQELMQQLNSFSKIVFGAGVLPSPNMPIDNSMLAMIANTGLLSWLVVIIIMFMVFERALSNQGRTIGMASFMFMFAVVSASNNVVIPYLMFASMVLLIIPQPSRSFENGQMSADTGDYV